MGEPIWHWPARVRATLLRFAAPLWVARVGRGCRIHRGLRIARPWTSLYMGPHSVLKHNVFVQTARGARISLGEGCLVNTGGHLVAQRRIRIGSGTRIGEYVSFRDQEHIPEHAQSVSQTPMRCAPVEIGRNVWIGRGCYIGPGVSIGDGAVIGANSVVRSDIPSGVLAAGAPAKVVRVLDGYVMDAEAAA